MVDADARLEAGASEEKVSSLSNLDESPADTGAPSRARSAAAGRQAAVAQGVLSDWRRGAAMTSPLDPPFSNAPLVSVVKPRGKSNVAEEPSASDAAAHRLLNVAAAIGRTRSDRSRVRGTSKQRLG